MTDYRYFTADILARTYGGVDLPLFGTYMNKVITRPGNFTGSFPLGTGIHRDEDMLAATTPGKFAIYCERDGQIVWGGPIWSRTYSADSRSCQITAQTWESVFDHVVFEEHVIQQSVEVTTLFENLIDQMQAQDGNDFNILVSSPVPLTGWTRTILKPNYEYHFVGSVLSELVTDTELEYAIDLGLTSAPDGMPQPTIRAGTPKLNDGVILDAAYDFPGSITNYWYPENASRGATRFAAIGAGSGNKVIRSVARDETRTGWPSWWQTASYPAIGSPETIAGKAQQGLLDASIPIVVPTIELAKDAVFAHFNSMGVTIQFNITDARFPNGHSFEKRMIGWELTPESSDAEELIRLSFEGDEDVG